MRSCRCGDGDPSGHASPTAKDEDDYPFSQRIQWNIEQATRRALRSLEQRGLVTLARYVFAADPVSFQGSIDLQWCYVHPSNHRPGKTRMMTGVLLTEAGWAIRAAGGSPHRSRSAGRD